MNGPLATCAFSAVLFAAACSAKSTGHPATTDTSAGGVGTHQGGSSSGSSGAVDGGVLSDGGLGCAAFDLTNAQVIGQQQVAEAAPVPVGGVIPDGTYVLSKDVLYTGPGGPSGATSLTLQEIRSFSGTTFQLASKALAPAPLLDESGTFTTSNVTNDAGTASGFTLTLTVACPSAAAIGRGYSVVNGQLLEFQGANEVLTFTHQ